MQSLSGRLHDFASAISDLEERLAVQIELNEKQAADSARREKDLLAENAHVKENNAGLRGVNATLRGELDKERNRVERHVKARAVSDAFVKGVLREGRDAAMAVAATTDAMPTAHVIEGDPHHELAERIKLAAPAANGHAAQIQGSQNR